MAEKFKQFATDAFIGGTEDQVIKKKSGSDFDYGWGDDGGGGGGGFETRQMNISLNSWGEYSSSELFNFTAGNVGRDVTGAFSGKALIGICGKSDSASAMGENSDSVRFEDGLITSARAVFIDTTYDEEEELTYNTYKLLDPITMEITFNLQVSETGAPTVDYFIAENGGDVYSGSNQVDYICMTSDDVIVEETQNGEGYAWYKIYLRNSLAFGTVQISADGENYSSVEFDARVPGEFSVGVGVWFSDPAGE